MAQVPVIFPVKNAIRFNTQSNSDKQCYKVGVQSNQRDIGPDKVKNRKISFVNTTVSGNADNIHLHFIFLLLKGVGGERSVIQNSFFLPEHVSACC